MNTNKKNNKGFTIIELLVALSVGTAILGVTILVVANGISNIRDIKYIERLHANTVHIVNEIRYAVSQAETLTLVNATELNVRFPDYTTTDIILDGNRIKIAGNTITDNSVRVTDLNFSVVGGSVRIAMQLETGSVLSPRSYSVNTTIAQRN